MRLIRGYNANLYRNIFVKNIIGFLIIILVCCIGGCGKKDKDASMSVNETNSSSSTNGDIQEAPVVSEETADPSATTGTATDKPVSTNKVSTQKPSSQSSLLEAKNSSSYTIVIDAGHQLHAMDEQEPIAPGATQTKPKVSSGTTGVASGVPEYKVTLEVSLLLRDLLKQKGYNVIMVRETHNVSISNSERAMVANNNNADAFVRIHCNGATDQSVKGALTMCQTKNNKYCGQYYSKSRSLSDKVLKRLCEATGAKNRGISETDSMSGINWCTVPVTIVEMGFMSNREEDLLLVDKNYQNKLAIGIANGIIEYLNGQ